MLRELISAQVSAAQLSRTDAPPGASFAARSASQHMGAESRAQLPAVADGLLSYTNISSNPYAFTPFGVNAEGSASRTGFCGADPLGAFVQAPPHGMAHRYRPLAAGRRTRTTGPPSMRRLLSRMASRHSDRRWPARRERCCRATERLRQSPLA